MEKFKCPEDPWSYVVGGSLPLGRISHWFQEKGQINSTSEDNEEKKESVLRAWRDTGGPP